MIGAQLIDRALEIVERVERLIDAREPEVSDLVELAEGAEDREADVVRIDLRRARLPDRLLDGLSEDGEIGLGDGPPWQALRTPDMTFSRLKGSTTPERLMTLRLASRSWRTGVRTRGTDAVGGC